MRCRRAASELPLIMPSCHHRLLPCCALQAAAVLPGGDVLPLSIPLVSGTGVAVVSLECADEYPQAMVQGV